MGGGWMIVRWCEEVERCLEYLCKYGLYILEYCKDFNILLQEVICVKIFKSGNNCLLLLILD